MRVFFDEEDLDAQFQRTLSHAYERAADIGEAFAAAETIEPGDDDSWYDAWTRAGDTARAAAEASARDGDGKGAADAWLRACEYYRQSYYFLRSDLADPRLLTGYRRMRGCFREALPDLPFGVTSVRIPYESTSMAGYLMFPSEADPPWPTVLLPAGYDNSAEDLYLYAAPAVRRGYAVLAFEGPGQGGSLFEDGLFFRPDFENVLTPVVDLAVELQDVDPRRLVLIGRSFGSYLAARGAASEHRLAAMICDPGQPDLSLRVRAAVPAPVMDLIRTKDPRAERVLAPMLSTGPGRRLWLPRMAAHGASTLLDYLHDLMSYTLADRIGDITCPTLVTEAEGDAAGGGSRLFYERLTCEREFRLFAESEGVSGHIGGAGQQVWNGYAFDWLARTLHVRS